MAQLVWDKVGDRIFEAGLDRGVLYLPDGTGVPWNGLTEVSEKSNKDAESVYFDGMKIQNLLSLADFEATMKAVTYPDEFVTLEGLTPIRNGVFAGEQPPGVFGLSYRTKIGNDVEGDTLGYKVHVVYNVTAIPSDKVYASISDDPSLVEFQWDIFAVPEEVSGIRPTAHYILDSRTVDPWLLEDVEAMLYGSDTESAELPSMSELITFMRDWYRLKITDLGDGTWKAESPRYGVIVISGVDEELFTLIGANVTYYEDGSFLITDTYDIADIPLIKFVNNGDGTWTATTSHDGLFTEIDGWFQILNANAVYLGPDKYQVSNTPATG